MTRVRTVHFLLIAAALAVPGAMASGSAQDRPQPADPHACLPQERLQDDADRPQSRDEKDGESLSDRLARTDGVICPPEIGPDIRLKPPDVGTMPVIPPPDEPGRTPERSQ